MPRIPKSRLLVRPKQRGKRKTKQSNPNQQRDDPRDDYAQPSTSRSPPADVPHSVDCTMSDTLKHEVDDKAFDEAILHTSFPVSSPSPSRNSAEAPECIEESPLKLWRSGKVPSTDVTLTISTEPKDDLSEEDVGVLPLYPTGDREQVSDTVEMNSPAQEVIDRLSSGLPRGWTARISNGGIQTMLLTFGIRCAVKRAVYLSFKGDTLRIQVHNKILPETHGIFSHNYMRQPVSLTADTIVDFSTVIKMAAFAVESYMVCAGIDYTECLEKWYNYHNCRLDENEFEEATYTRTLRKLDCNYLIPHRGHRCSNCSSFAKNVKKRLSRLHPDGEVKPNTRLDFLSPKRLKHVAKNKEKLIRAQSLQLSRLKKRIHDMLSTEGVDIDEELDADLRPSFSTATGVMKIFMEQQQKAANVKTASGMKWHPLMLRWALHIKSVSSAAYSAMRDSGFMKLPSERTLYEYVHANPTQEGIQHHVVKKLGDLVLECKDEFQTYFVVMMDEVYLFKNVIYDKGTGEIKGYAHLDEVEKEISALEREFQGDYDPEGRQPLASTMSTYMVKGVANGFKAVVACFPTASLTATQHYKRTWDVVYHIEKSGGRVIALIGDGSSVNVSFFQMHPPITPIESGVVFDTLNIHSEYEDRPMYFFNDTPHLLKTARNCFANSGAHRNTRLLTKNGEVISWKTIIAVYRTEEKKTLRFCHKLTALAVYLTSWSIMKVRPAAIVFSNTVAMFIEMHLKMPNTTETVKMIRWFNNTFDCLNGAHTDQARRTKNPNLAAYTDVNDARFEYLLSFLQYLEDWKREVAALPIDDHLKPMRLLSEQTMNGYERTIRAFVSCVKFLIEKRPTYTDESTGENRRKGYIIPRVFQSDPLEHNFSRQRQMGGGGSQLTVPTFLRNQNIIEMQGNLGIKRKRGNTEAIEELIDIEAPLPKRKKKRKVARQLDIKDITVARAQTDDDHSDGLEPLSAT